MTDADDTKQNSLSEESFAEMFEASEGVRSVELKAGDKIKGAIISIGKDSFFVDTGAKVDGVAEKEEFLDDEGNFPYKEGDELELYVVSATSNEIRLSKALSGQGGLEALSEAFAARVPVEGRVMEACKGGYRVKVMGRMAFCPISQIDIRFVEEAEAYVGITARFVIIKFEENGRNIVLSRRSLLEAEREEKLQELLQEIGVGDVVEGKVARLAGFGAFIEIAPGVEGLAHISELSWSRVEEPAEVVSEGQTVSVKILKIDDAGDGKPPKISLSMKQAQGDPWSNVPEGLKPGEKVTGKVTRLAKFGAFIEIFPGIEGLAHISELSYAKRIMDPAEVVKPGEAVSVMIKDVDVDNKRVSLSVKDAEGDPWLDVDQKFKSGEKITGTVEGRAQFGMFVNLCPGITGLLPKSKIERAANKSDLDKLKTGDSVELVIESVDAAGRKISLSTGQSEGGRDDENRNWKSYTPKSEPQGMGLLGEKLAKAMSKKNK